MEINMDVNTNYDRWDDFEENTRRSLGSSHHHAILSHTGVNIKLENTVSVNSQLSGVDIKTHQIFINSTGNENIILMGDRVTGSFEIGGDFTWGGSEGTEGSAHLDAHAEDDRGNTYDFHAEQNTDGSGNASGSVNHNDKQ